jgi:Yip1 domain
MSLSHDTSAGISSTAPSPEMVAPGLVGRVKRMLLAPATEWARVARESTTPARLFCGYVMPLASLAAFVALARFSRTVHAPVVGVLAMVALTLGFEVLAVFVAAQVINALAKSFGGVPIRGQALKVATYAFTPLWVAALFIPFPALSVPLLFLAGLYHTYLMYIGLRVLMRSPRDRALGYATTVVLCSMILYIVFTQISVGLGETLHLGRFRAFG